MVLSLLLFCGACAKQPPDLLIRTPFGPIPIVLDRSESLDATGKLLDLAARHSSGGEFIRAEARPAGNPAIPGGGRTPCSRERLTATRCHCQRRARKRRSALATSF